VGRVCRRRPCRAAGGVGLCRPAACALQRLRAQPDRRLGQFERLIVRPRLSKCRTQPGEAQWIIALLVCLAATVTTGLMGYGEQSKGPLAAVLVTDAKANGKPRALNFPSIKKSAWAAASKLSELSGFVRLAAGGT
jgi:hypothetical protein